MDSQYGGQSEDVKYLSIGRMQSGLIVKISKIKFSSPTILSDKIRCDNCSSVLFSTALN